MKKLLIVFLIIFTIGCSSTPPVIVDPVGRQFPIPHYFLQDTRGYGLSVVFYYSTFQEVKDLDGAVIQKPIYLEMQKINEIPKGSKIVLTIEVYNPNKHTYELWERVHLVKNGKDTYHESRGSRIATSKLQYRQFVYELSTDPSLKMVSYGVDLSNDKGEMLIHIGKFNYLVSSSNIISSEKMDTKDVPIIHNVKGGKGIAQETKGN